MSRKKVYGTALILSLVLNAGLVLLTPLTARLHEQGVAQPITGALNSVAHLLEAPGTALVGGAYAVRRMHQRHWAVVAANVALYFAAWTAMGMSIALSRRPSLPGERNAPPPQEDPRLPPESPASFRTRPEAGRLLSRRQLLTLGGAAFTVPLGLGGYSVLVEPRWLQVSRVPFPLRDLPEALDGLRLVQLTDIHLGPWLSVDRVRTVVECANGLQPDVMLLTGDYVHKSRAYIPQVAEALAALRPRIGTVAVLGNHDWWHGAEETRLEFRKRGFRLLDNSRLFVTPERRLSPTVAPGLCLAGVGDLWEDQCLYAQALEGVPGDVPRLLLSHNPDAAEDPRLTRGGWRVDLMVSGHTHGGQVSLPFFGPPVIPSRFGNKYAHGLVEGPACPVFVSRGVGMSLLPIRCGARPEITLLELRRQA
jgi:predicted MPP superfamily phosphohydrolase